MVQFSSVAHPKLAKRAKAFPPKNLRSLKKILVTKQNNLKYSFCFNVECVSELKLRNSIAVPSKRIQFLLLFFTFVLSFLFSFRPRNFPAVSQSHILRILSERCI